MKFVKRKIDFNERIKSSGSIMFYKNNNLYMEIKLKNNEVLTFFENRISIEFDDGLVYSRQTDYYIMENDDESAKRQE